MIRVGWQSLGQVILIFLWSRLAFYTVALLASWVLPVAGDEASLVDVKGPLGLALHYRFDAIHYYSIAVGGYNFYHTHPMPNNEPGVLPAFFPLLPALMRVTATLLGGLQWPPAAPITEVERLPLLAGVLVNHAVALLAFCLLFRLAFEETDDEATARRAVLYTAIFPLAFFYAVPYTEALFLATTVGAFLAARRGQWLRAGCWAAAAATTRLAGLLLLPVLLLEIILAARPGDLRPVALRRAVPALLLVPFGLLLFMLYLGRRTGDSLAFLHAQVYWHRERLFPLTTLWRGVRSIFPPFSSDWIDHPERYGRHVFQTLIVLGFLAVLLASLRKWRPSYVLYGLLLLGLGLASPLAGDQPMQSQGRYIMVFFPVYITLARWGRRPSVHQAIVLLWLPLFGLLAALFVRWYFVA
jgi:hypothetical protein